MRLIVPHNVQNHRAATSDCPCAYARLRGSGAFFCSASLGFSDLGKHKRLIHRFLLIDLLKPKPRRNDRVLFWTGAIFNISGCNKGSVLKQLET